MSAGDSTSASGSDAPLLQVDRLTLKFRGLTAVDNVDLKVPPRAIFAVIGPNGAGKTSLFNAITGINEPTAGTVAFEGQDLRKPLTRRHYLRWGGVGLFMAVFCLLLASDVNVMWAAVIKQNFQTREQGFQVRQALADVGNYLAARPRIEQRAGRFSVVTHDGQRPFGALRTLDEARQRQAEIARDEDGSAAAARRTRVLAAFVGLLLGFAGAYAVWRQTRRTPSSVASRGIARTFQNIRLFQEMTVLENVLVGMDRHLRARPGRSRWDRRALAAASPLIVVAMTLVLLVVTQRWEVGGPALWGTLLVLFFAGFVGYLVYIARLGAFSRDTIAVEAAARAEGAKLLSFVGLADKQKERAKNLSYGDQRRLEIARALATKARLLLLDEPAAGMNPAETVSLMKLIRDIRDSGVTVLLIEHHMRVVMGISDRIAVLEYGQKIAEGTPEEIRANPRVIEAYLGKEEQG